MWKKSQIRTLIKKLLAKYWFFKKLPQISRINKNRNFSSIILFFKTNCFYPMNFMTAAWEIEEYSFPILPVLNRLEHMKSVVIKFKQNQINTTICFYSKKDENKIQQTERNVRLLNLINLQRINIITRELIIQYMRDGMYKWPTWSSANSERTVNGSQLAKLEKKSIPPMLLPWNL